MEDQIAQFVGGVPPLMIHASDHHIVDAEIDLMGELLAPGLHKALGAPAADQVGQQLSGPGGGETAALHILLEEGIQILVGTAPMGVAVHGVLRHLGHPAEAHKLQGFLECAGRILRHITADTGDLQQLFPADFVRLRRRLLLRQPGVAPAQSDHGVQHDDRALPEIRLGYVRISSRPEFRQMGFRLGDVSPQAHPQDLVPVEGSSDLSENGGVQGGILQLGVLQILWRELNRNLMQMTGLAGSAPSWDEPNGNCLVFNRHSNVNCSTIKDLTATEINTRKAIRDVIAYCKRVLPGAYKDMYLLSIAPQTGVRCSRRLSGEYVMSAKDWVFGLQHDDVIAWHSTICRLNDCAPVEIPYRAILPRKVDNLLCPGRHISADPIAIDWVNLIPQCIGTGQAAGVAAAVAVADGVGTHSVDIRKVQNILIDQNVPLPRNERVDPCYEELCREFDYGRYTEIARQAKEDPSIMDNYKPRSAWS